MLDPRAEQASSLELTVAHPRAATAIRAAPGRRLVLAALVRVARLTRRVGHPHRLLPHRLVEHHRDLERHAREGEREPQTADEIKVG